MDKVPEYDTIITGAGPAGLFAAANIVKGRTLILEKKELPGRKLMISGTGQCNFTHNGPLNDFFTHYGDNYSFVKPALKVFTNQDAIAWFGKRGVETVTDKNGKVFPRSLRAGEILNALLTAIGERQTLIRTGTQVADISLKNGFFSIKTAHRTYTCKNLILATGGLSYPSTGSSGDGYAFAEKMGHTLVEPRPALSPVFVKDYQFASLAGVSLDNVLIRLFRENREIRNHRGDTGFTHKGLSGPGILDFSRYFRIGDTLKINLCNLEEAAFEKQFTIHASLNGKLPVLSFFKNSSMPRNLARAIIGISGISPEKPMAEISKKSRKTLTELCCSHPFVIDKIAGFSTAMATSGGISLDEVDPLTMESRLVKNLFFAGEVLDIDGDTGGYNIQAAFSTAWMAAQAINKNG
ncbi:flavoprotein, HI0933 family [Lentimicrobium saccharophilum]|uniref:Flavoprotein, HI0933 family n=1 Tax=Lentimicrobium saccharophilum TaxID=1678841 RepID=A0A0S7C136_9BACT|nr:NAD(P)/FAD-dependent oxidoreductase [Lentimicrobium saccharophilum]GAP43046.1 flavoprotein, HI0933 family [Lentimicrobium saccharophilum]